MGRVSALVSASARLGLGRLYGQFAFGSLPPRSRDEVRASIATASNAGSFIDEFVQANASREQAASLGDFADKPLVVLTAGSGGDDAWSAAQNDLATLSTSSVHRVIDGATHEALIANEEGRRRHHSSDPRRRLIGPQRTAAGQVIRSAAARASPSTCAGPRRSWLQAVPCRNPYLLDRGFARPSTEVVPGSTISRPAQDEPSDECPLMPRRGRMAIRRGNNGDCRLTQRYSTGSR